LALISAPATSRGGAEDGGGVLTVSVRGGSVARGAGLPEADVTPVFVVLLITDDSPAARAEVSFFGVITVGLGVSATRATVSDGSSVLFFTLESTGSVFFTPSGVGEDSGFVGFDTEAGGCADRFVFIGVPEVTAFGSVCLSV